MRFIPLIIRASLYAFFATYALFLFFPEINYDIETWFIEHRREIFILLVADIAFGFGMGWEQWKTRRRLKKLGITVDDPKRINFLAIGKDK